MAGLFRLIESYMCELYWPTPGTLIASRLIGLSDFAIVTFGEVDLLKLLVLSGE